MTQHLEQASREKHLCGQPLAAVPRRTGLGWVVVIGLVLTACSKPDDSPSEAGGSATEGRSGAAPASAIVAAAATAGASMAAAAELPAPGKPTTADGGPERGIAWQHAANDAEVEAAFALARRENKPVFVYWGAKWCPPCNQLQATLFNRHDFIERSRAFVPVYVDGDKPGAQKLGARFKVRGYPTMVLFDPAGTELTRLPGEVDAEQYNQVLTLGMAAQRPAKAVLADALAGGDAPRGLGANDWKLLAFYSWDTDEQQLAPKDKLPDLLRQLGQACPPEQAQTATRLLLRAVAAAAPTSDAKRVNPRPVWPDAETLGELARRVADPAMARAQADVLSNRATELVRGATAPGTPQRQLWVDVLNVALKGLAADTTLSRADRMMAVIARVDLARLDLATRARPVLPEPLLAEVRDHAARADREITDGHERQAVVTTAAYMLERAGLADESDALLQSNLGRSHSPYYLMSALASNAKKRGDVSAALGWYEQAFDKSEGAATRLQWGASYLGALIDLAPTDEARIERAAQQLLAEAASQPNVFYERSARSLQQAGRRLLGWNQGGRHAGVLKRLQAQLDAVCGQLDRGDPQREVCEGLLRPAAGTPSRAV